MNDVLYVGYRDRVGNPTGPTDDQVRACNQWRHPETMAQLLRGGSGSGKTTQAVKTCIDEGMANPGLNQFWGHLHLGLFGPGPFAALDTIVPKTLVEIDGQLVWTMEFKRERDDKVIIIRLPGYIHPTFGYTTKITYWGLDPKFSGHKKLEKQGGSFGLGFFDQLDLLPDDRAFRAFFTRLRLAPMKIVATTNPDKSGWWNTYWTDDPRFETPDTKHYVQITMNPDGNPHTHSRYTQTMRRNLSDDQVTRMVEGLDIYEGEKVYEEFSPVENTVDVPHKIPEDWILDEWWDYGWNDPANVCLTAITPDNESILIDVFRVSKAIPTELAESWLNRKDALLSRGRKHGEKKPQIRMRVCDPRMFNSGMDGGKCIADQIAEYDHPTGEKIFLSPASLKRVRKDQTIKMSQILAVKEIIKERRFKVGRDCHEFYEEHDSYVWDEKTQMPKDYRKMNKGTVIHHHDTLENVERMAGAIYIPQPEDEEAAKDLGNGYKRVDHTRPSKSGVVKALRAFS